MAGDGSRRGKVARLIDEHDLDGDWLVEEWTRPDDERKSLRQLADAFNRRLLAAELPDVGPTQVERYHEALTDDDASAGVRTEVEVELADRGIDVDELRGEFVSYQSIRTYVQARGASYEGRSAEEQRAKDVESIERLRGRLASVTEERLDRGRRADRLTLGEYRLFVDVTVYCEDCGSQFEATEVLETGGCDCDS
ncbi:rod-determining factor RdfA [Haloarchaeobius iranensis]|uniref:Uncharacterized protein n=1 Tax=Haloarchaeobius iranensis TaxID=996166 RepID=A0A1G9UWF1_9EURY|nr:rod-determining factor RdfA [Haloarchaeobius iranensis]SDM64097.1 hypothetical protein SAMN05192554_10537 [Haloarchaeobius iranensis]